MAKSRVFAAVDLGGTNTILGLLSEKGEVLERLEVPTAVEDGYDDVVDRIADGLRLMIGSRSVVGIGIGAPGPLDAERGVIIESPNLEGFNNRPLALDLAKRCELPVFLENDANAAALAESWIGAGRQARDLIVLTVGTGIGGGLILGGRLYRGSAFSAGEVGHMTIEPNGPVCACGNQGCLEVLASAPAIAARAREKVQKGFETRMLDLAGGDPAAISAETVSLACDENDPVALRVLEETGRYLGIGTANLINVLNPQLVLFGGGGARAGEFLLAPIRKEVERRSFAGLKACAEIGPCTLGDDAGLIGAARVAMDGS